MLQVFESAVLALADRLRTRGERLVTAESCTGGLIAAACTAVAGSSDWFERGIVSYSNEAKTELLGVPAVTIAAHGAVSEPVVVAMAEGALRHAHAHWAVAVTGIAGPGGAVPGKPVGTVWLAVAHTGDPTHVPRPAHHLTVTPSRATTTLAGARSTTAAAAYSITCPSATCPNSPPAGGRRKTSISATPPAPSAFPTPVPIRTKPCTSRYGQRCSLAVHTS